ncbi:IS110 family transposase [Mucilaginibacter sp. SG564]|uniref:IS110 family transposase n=1 Tax=Mucilaginibacter sp. SG564 TaxID=2587022 RepID=UPI0015551E35|nr:IS110 family transposase [Mucilaginibacter sp. SG564]NOW94008.1 transposase [Mucilaginibacter sp. SG564]
MPKTKNYTYFIGIDVSRNKLDFAVMQANNFLFHREIKNITDDIQALIIELKQLPKFTVSKAIFGMEQTGFYSNHLLNSLKKIKANIVLENALHIRMSLGNIRGKHDKIDAIRIAQYVHKNRDNVKFYVPKRMIIEKLAHLSSLRNRLISISKALETPIKEQITFINKGINRQTSALCKDSIISIKTDIVRIDESIMEIVNSDDLIKRLFTIITSVPCVGPVTAIQIIISTNEFKDISDPKKFACYAGVAPFKRESGLITGKARVSSMANKKMKALLHTCALGAIRCFPELKEYYKRKTKIEGKPKMAVLNAVRNKLVLRIFTCVNQDRCFEKEYIKPVNELIFDNTEPLEK